MEAPDHNRALATAAKAALTPLGMTRKGRSRTWLADRGYMAGIVEFQPSAWSKGTYLNVGLMWLWQPTDHVAFEAGPVRVGQFVDLQDPDSLEADAADVAEVAARSMRDLLATYDGLKAVVKELTTSTRRRPSPRLLGHLGTAYGLLGDLDRARKALDSALAAREDARSGAWNALRYLVDVRESMVDHATFRPWVADTVAATRTALKLPARDDALDAV